jgi:hypothetical protein
LLITQTDFSVIALIGIILLDWYRQKNAIMMIDFALEAERKGGKNPDRRDLSGLSAAFPAHSHDHHGGHAGRLAAWPSGAWRDGRGTPQGRWASRSSAAR